MEDSETEEPVGWEVREVRLPAAGDQGAMSAVAEACGVVLSRLTEPGSRERFEFLNNQVYWNLSRLASGDASWPRPGAEPGCFLVREALLLSLSAARAQVIRECIDIVYDEKGVPLSDRLSYDLLFELFVAMKLAENGMVHLIDESSGEERLPPPLAHLMAN